MRTPAKNTPTAPRAALPYLCGAVGGPLFVIAFLIQGAVRPDYDPMRHPVSSLALGPSGWTQVANFVELGGLFQRISITAGFFRVSFLAVHMMRAPRGSVPARPA